MIVTFEKKTILDKEGFKSFWYTANDSSMVANSISFDYDEALQYYHNYLSSNGNVEQVEVIFKEVIKD